MGNLRATELRIGNWVYISDNYTQMFFKQETQINIHNMMYLCGETKEPLDFTLEPIPLTEEWLFKFGFEKKENGLFTKKLEYIYNSLKYCDDYKIWIYYNDDNDAACNAIADLNYVHELQNLYFALTNEELTMK